MQTLKLFLRVLLFLLFVSCQNSFELPPDVNNGIGGFNILTAQTYFESNAQDLSSLRFTNTLPATRASLSSLSELVPEWKSAVQSNYAHVSLVEVPINSTMQTLSIQKKFSNGKMISQKLMTAFRRLIVAHLPNGRTDMFMVTVFPASQRGQKMDENKRNFRYLGGVEFNGRVFCSTLDGRFVEAWEYSDGKRFPLRVTTRKYLAQRGDNLEEGEYQSLLFTEGMQTKSGTYNSFNETGGGGDERCPIHSQYELNSCPMCVDVIVRYCQVCHNQLEPGENCYCRCAWCGQYPCRCCFQCGSYPCRCSVSSCPICYPLACTKCNRCGSHYCYGFCGTGGGGAGGGTTGGGGTGSVPGQLAGSVFNNRSNLSQSQWNLLEDALENINNDCLGGKLVGDLKNKNINIIFNDGNVMNGSYNYEENSMVINNTSPDDVADRQFERTILHELLHSGQTKKSSAAMNMEIEAHLISYRYSVKNGIELQDPLYNNIYFLSLTMDAQYNIVDQEEYNYAYQLVVDSFKAHQYYKTYPESVTDRNMNTAKKFTADCLY